MQESNDEIARRVLAAVLERLGASSSQQNGASALNQAPGTSAGEPVVVIVLGQANSDSAACKETRRPLNEAPLARAANGSQSGFRIASHPGLEKFPQPQSDSEPNARAPKTCFMEPDRPCVNSGACEMRGY